jgi:MoaA/NifB/PqqE/SkfB family radical SAM enzyme
MTSLRALLSHLTGRARAAAPPVVEAIPYKGIIEQLSPFHVAGWAENPANSAERTALIVRRADTGDILARGRADNFRHTLTRIGASDDGHGFFIRFASPLDVAALAQVEVAPSDGGAPLPRAAHVSPDYQPLMLIAGDIVDNCNLRCPFCLYDYTNVRATNVMEEATIEAALRFLPYVTESNFWFSCLHEPTLHPDLMRFIEKVPREWRQKLFYTTNLAKRMPPEYYPWLADAGLHHVNISIESRVPEIYERMRKGARFRIFQENWDLLMEAASGHPNPTPIRYITMVYRSNYRELPELVNYLLEERRGSLIELRYTFVAPWLPADFREAEFLEPEGWLWLRDQLAGYSAERVRLIMPPEVTPKTPSLDIELTNRTNSAAGVRVDEGVRHFLPGRYQTRLSWNGNFEITPFWAHPYEEGPGQAPIRTVNVRDIDDPIRFLLDLPD